MNLVHLKDRLERFRAGAARLRERAKEGTELLVCTALGAATAGALGALDEAKGESKDNDEGILTHEIGPLPTSLIVAAVGKTGALLTMGEGLTMGAASSVGQAGLDSWSYVMGRRLWKRHEKQSTGARR